MWANSAAFFTYLRGAIRQIWSRYPAKLKWKQEQLTDTKPDGYTGRGKKFGKCHYCDCQFAASSLEVDHVDQAGSCNSWETAYAFLHKLLNCNDNWVLACKPCHKIKSYAERYKLDFEEARAVKMAVAYEKHYTLKAIIDFCAAAGYNSASTKSAKGRREALKQIFKKELDMQKTKGLT